MSKDQKRNRCHNNIRVTDPTYLLARKKKKQSTRPMNYFVDRAMKKTYPLEYKQALQKVQQNRKK